MANEYVRNRLVIPMKGGIYCYFERLKLNNKNKQFSSNILSELCYQILRLNLIIIINLVTMLQSTVAKKRKTYK